MATVTLNCGHPGIVTHERGERRIICAVPKCGQPTVVAARSRVETVYDVQAPKTPIGEQSFDSGLVEVDR